MPNTATEVQKECFYSALRVPELLDKLDVQTLRSLSLVNKYCREATFESNTWRDQYFLLDGYFYDNNYLYPVNKSRNPPPPKPAPMPPPGISFRSIFYGKKANLKLSNGASIKSKRIPNSRYLCEIEQRNFEAYRQYVSPNQPILINYQRQAPPPIVLPRVRLWANARRFSSPIIYLTLAANGLMLGGAVLFFLFAYKRAPYATFCNKIIDI